jgi:hypothetical protein
MNRKRIAFIVSAIIGIVIVLLAVLVVVPGIIQNSGLNQISTDHTYRLVSTQVQGTGSIVAEINSVLGIYYLLPNTNSWILSGDTSTNYDLYPVSYFLSFMNLNNAAINTNNSNFVKSSIASNVIGIASDFLKNRLGQNYYDRYVHPLLEVPTYNSNISIVYFSYNIPIANSIIISNEIAQNSGIVIVNNTIEGSIIVPVYNNGSVILNTNNSVMLYNGPMRPYYISVSPDYAIKIAKRFGLYADGYNTTYLASLNYVVKTGNNYTDISPMVFVWVVYVEGKNMGNCLNPNFEKGIYIDAESGNIIGRFNGRGCGTA